MFAAVERLCERHGPAGLSSRAVATEAGCAKGLLYNHFGDLEQFLVRYALSRFECAVSSLKDLPDCAGQGDVEANLTDAAGRLFTHSVLVAHSIVTLRPTVAARMVEVRQREHGTSSAGTAELEQIFARYLEAEKALGRVRADCDAEAVALAVVATVHHLLLARRPNQATGRATVARVIVAFDTTGRQTVRPQVQNA